MKRSSDVRLSSMNKSFKLGSWIPGIAIGGFYLLLINESETEGYVFLDAQECERGMPGYSAECAMAYKEAQDRAEQSAPRYTSERECEQDFDDDCYYSSTYRSHVPELDAFFFTTDLDDLKHYNKKYYSEPLYRYRNGYFNGSGSAYGSFRMQSTKVVSSSLNKPGGTIGKAMSRGGFGKSVSMSRGG